MMGKREDGSVHQYEFGVCGVHEIAAKGGSSCVECQKGFRLALADCLRGDRQQRLLEEMMENVKICDSYIETFERQKAKTFDAIRRLNSTNEREFLRQFAVPLRCQGWVSKQQSAIGATEFSCGPPTEGVFRDPTACVESNWMTRRVPKLKFRFKETAWLTEMVFWQMEGVPTFRTTQVEIRFFGERKGVKTNVSAQFALQWKNQDDDDDQEFRQTRRQTFKGSGETFAQSHGNIASFIDTHFSRPSQLCARVWLADACDFPVKRLTVRCLSSQCPQGNKKTRQLGFNPKVPHFSFVAPFDFYGLTQTVHLPLSKKLTPGTDSPTFV